MGMFDTLKLDSGVQLPHFPDSRDPTDFTWQTKDIGMPSMDTYRLTEDGQLLRREEDMREKTADEKQVEAADHGFDSWDDYVTAVRETSLKEGLDADLPMTVSEKTVESVWWANHNPHGSFEFHASVHRHEGWPDIVLSYEARFNRGELQEIVFLGDRHGNVELDAAIDALESVDA